MMQFCALKKLNFGNGSVSVIRYTAAQKNANLTLKISHACYESIDYL